MSEYAANFSDVQNKQFNKSSTCVPVYISTFKGAISILFLLNLYFSFHLCFNKCNLSKLKGTLEKLREADVLKRNMLKSRSADGASPGLPRFKFKFQDDGPDSSPPRWSLSQVMPSTPKEVVKQPLTVELSETETSI